MDSLTQFAENFQDKHNSFIFSSCKQYTCQKLADIFARFSYDYDGKAQEEFYSLIKFSWSFGDVFFCRKRAVPDSPTMGLTHWENAPDGEIVRKDVLRPENYFTKEEAIRVCYHTCLSLEEAERQLENEERMSMENLEGKLLLLMDNIIRPVAAGQEFKDVFCDVLYEFRIAGELQDMYETFRKRQYGSI